MGTYFLNYFPPTLDRSSVLFHYPNSTERASGELSLRKCPPSLLLVPLLVFLLLLPRRRLRRVSPAATNSSLSAPLSLSQLSLSPVAHSPARTEEQKEEEEERVRPIRPHTVSSPDARRRNIRSLVGDRTQQPERKRGGLKNLLRGREGAAGFFFACYHPPSSASPPASSPFSAAAAARRGGRRRAAVPLLQFFCGEKEVLSLLKLQAPPSSPLFSTHLLLLAAFYYCSGVLPYSWLSYFSGEGLREQRWDLGRTERDCCGHSQLQSLESSSSGGANMQAVDAQNISPPTKKQHRRETFVECAIFAKAAKVDDFPRRTSCFDFLIRQESEQRK